MKKILYFLISIFILSGCSDLSNTPTKQTEAFLKKYQALDNEVLTDLNEVIDNENLNDNQKNLYRDIMKKHYQNLSYEVKEETIDGNNAIVKVEITVTDLKRALNESNEYLNSHREEFNENGNYSLTKFNDYRLNKLKEAKEKIKYTLNISLTKINDKWTIDKLSKENYDKINGTY